MDLLYVCKLKLINFSFFIPKIEYLNVTYYNHPLPRLLARWKEGIWMIIHCLSVLELF